MHITDCCKASIYTLDNNYLLDASVSGITEGSAQLTFNGPSADLLRSEVLVTFYDNYHGLVSYECQLSGYQEYLVSSGVWHSKVLCTLEKAVSVIQRRKDLKIHIHVPAELSFTDSKGKFRNAKAIIHNISAGGVFLACPSVFPVGQMLKFPFRAGEKSLLLTVEVLRAEPPAGEGDPQGYGCRFVDLAPYTEAAIRNYVYRQDLLFRKH